MESTNSDSLQAKLKRTQEHLRQQETQYRRQRPSIIHRRPYPMKENKERLHLSNAPPNTSGTSRHMPPVGRSQDRFKVTPSRSKPSTLGNDSPMTRSPVGQPLPITKHPLSSEADDKHRNSIPQERYDANSKMPPVEEVTISDDDCTSDEESTPNSFESCISETQLDLPSWANTNEANSTPTKNPSNSCKMKGTSSASPHTEAENQNNSSTGENSQKSCKDDVSFEKRNSEVKRILNKKKNDQKIKNIWNKAINYQKEAHVAVTQLMNELRQLTSMHSNTLGFTNNKETLEDISAHVKSAQKLTRLAKCVDVELQILRKTRKENKSVTVSCDKLSGFFRSITELKNSIKNS